MKHLLILLFILIYLSSHSQDRKDGNIISISGDTLYGEIWNRSNIYLSEKCKFKANNKNKGNTYLPSEIKSFKFNDGRYFVSATIPDYNKNEKNVFLEYLVKGKANLFYYKDKETEKFFIRIDNDSLIELKNSINEVSNNFGTTPIEKKEYIGQLSYLFTKEVPTLRKKVEYARLETTSLINLTKVYNESVCDSTCITFLRDTKPKISTGGFFGFSTYKLDMAARNTYYFHNDKFNAKSASIGYFYEFSNLIGLSENFSFVTEANLQFVRLENINSKFNIHGIRFPLYVRYCISKSKISPFFTMGSIVCFFSSSIDTEDPVLKASVKNNSKNASVAILFGGGLIVKVNKKFDFFVHFNNYYGQRLLHNDFSYSFLNLQLNSMNYQMGLKYRLHK